jgi:uncharacterized membrane protein
MSGFEVFEELVHPIQRKARQRDRISYRHYICSHQKYNLELFQLAVIVTGGAYSIIRSKNGMVSSLQAYAQCYIISLSINKT